MPHLRLRFLILTIILLICIFFVPVGYYLFNPSLELNAVQRALATYFAEQGRYPETLDLFIKQGKLRKKSLTNIYYAPIYGSGSYEASWTRGEKDFFGQWPICIRAGAPFSQITQRAKAMKLRDNLRLHYTISGNYPRDLLVHANNHAHVYVTGIQSGEYEYTVSRDLQSFTMNGEFLGPPSTWSSERSVDPKADNIMLLKYVLNHFYEEKGRYPKELQELVESGMPASVFESLTEGESIDYRISADGMAAYLDNVKLE